MENLSMVGLTWEKFAAAKQLMHWFGSNVLICLFLMCWVPVVGMKQVLSMIQDVSMTLVRIGPPCFMDTFHFMSALGFSQDSFKGS